MGRGRKIAAVLCAIVLLLGLPRASADQIDIYLLAENDVMTNLPVEAMPAWIGGVLYIPYTAFDWTVTKVNLGVSYGQEREGDEYRLTLYSLNNLLTFDVNRGTCVDREGQPLNMRAVYRNGWVFVPAVAVCGYFGLGYSYTPTNYGTLIRITNGQQRLGSEFVQYAENSMRDRYNDYMKQLNPATPQPTAQPTPRPAATPEPNQTDLTVCLSVLVTGGGDLDGILDALEAANLRALFLFSPEELTAYGEQLRRMAGSGHLIGLSPTGDSLEEVQAQLAQGQEDLARLAHTTTHTVYLPSAGPAVAGALESEGWRCWTAQLQQLEDSRSAYNRSAALLNAFGRRRGSAGVLLDDGTGTAALLKRLLPILPEEGCRVRLPLETYF